MRSRALSLLAGSSVVAVALAAACSSDDAAPPAGDAGDEPAPREAAAYVPEDASPSCDPDADLTENVQDAQIVDGASTTGICVTCMHARCSAELTACASDCVCQGIMGDAIGCYLTTQQLACLGRLANYLVSEDTRAKALELSGCAKTSCPEACAVDAGATDAAAD